MKTRILTALAIAIAASTVHAAAPWTSVKVGKLTFNNVFTVRSDGRFLYSENHELYSQNSFGSATKTKINRGSLSFDPSFIAVKDLTTAIVGEGGFTSSGVHVFNPAMPTITVSSAALDTLQNFAAVWWHHPTSGREGWIIGGANASGKNNLTFVSADGLHNGALTDILCTYSAGIAADAVGNVFAALSGDTDAETVIEFTAAQIDSAVAAVISGTAAPLAKGVASTVHQFGGAASIAVDKIGRVWACSYLTNDLEVFDPVGSKTWHVTPSHAALAEANGSPTYQVQTFVRNGVANVAFLANDSAFNADSDVVYGSAPVENLVSIDTASQTVAESAGTLSIGVSISPAPTKAITIPVVVSGTATKGSDYTLLTPSVVFGSGQTTSMISVKISDDPVDEPINNETLVLTLGIPTAGALITDANKHTITITDNDLRPLFSPGQTLTQGRVGSSYSYTVSMVPSVPALPTTFKATGLPKGWSIDKNNGIISGRGALPGEYSNVVVTATNSAGVSLSSGFVLIIEDYAAAAHGSFIGVLPRGVETNDLGGRIDINTTATATFTGKVMLGKNSYSISGPLDTQNTNPTGSYTVKVGAASFPLSFTLDASTGNLSGQLGQALFTGWHCQLATTLTGSHNFQLDLAPIVPPSSTPVPQGIGFGTAKVLANGQTTITGKAGDGSSYTSSALIGVNGELPVNQILYTNPGSLLGSITIAATASHPVTGSLDWSKPAQAAPPYMDGWANSLTVDVKGGKYYPVSGSTAPLGMADGSGYDAQLTFGLPSIAIPQWGGAALIPPSGPITPPLRSRIVITNATGAISGELWAPAFGSSTSTKPFVGLLIPDTSTADPFDAAGVGYYTNLASNGGNTHWVTLISTP